MSISDAEFLHYTTDGHPYVELLDYARRTAAGVGVTIGRRGPRETRGQSSLEGGLRIGWELEEEGLKRSAGVAIADLFHELGHTRQPRLRRGDPASIVGSLEQQAREMEAWEVGKKLLEAFPGEVPADFWPVFALRREECLGSYGPRMARGC